MYRISGDVKEARSPAPPAVIVAAEEIFLSMASYLSRSTSFDKVS